MREQSHKFLNELLNIASPSGMEMEIQKKWKAYVQSFAHKVNTDHAGNVIGILNPDASFKVLLAGHCDEIGMIVSGIDDKGNVRVQKVGGISPKSAVGMKVEIYGYNGTVTGVFGVNAEHHGGIKDGFKFEDLHIDCGAQSKEEMEALVQVGDMAVFKTSPEFLLNDRFSARGLDNRTGAYIVAEVLKRLAELGCEVGVYAVSTVNEETNMGGAYFAAAGIEASMAIACDVTFATDYPGVNQEKHGEIALGKGPVLAKGAPINYKINRLLEESARALNMNIQYELTPSLTGTDADKMRLTGRGVPVALVSLPLRYMHSPVETVSLKDIEDEIQLLTHMIQQLTGKENLKPVE